MKIFKTVELATEYEQDIRIQPTPEWDGITIEFREIGEKWLGNSLYLDKSLLNTLIVELDNMMDYTLKNES